MSWYEYQPFRWILENLTSKQIVNIIVGIFIVMFLFGSYHVYLDAVQIIGNHNLWVLKTIFSFLLFLVFIIIFSTEFRLIMGL